MKLAEEDIDEFYFRMCRIATTDGDVYIGGVAYVETDPDEYMDGFHDEPYIMLAMDGPIPGLSLLESEIESIEVLSPERHCLP